MVHQADQTGLVAHGVAAAAPLLGEMDGQLQRLQRLFGPDLEGVRQRRAKQLSRQLEVGVEKIPEPANLLLHLLIGRERRIVARLKHVGQSGSVHRARGNANHVIGRLTAAHQKRMHDAELHDRVECAAAERQRAQPPLRLLSAARRIRCARIFHRMPPSKAPMQP